MIQLNQSVLDNKTTNTSAKIILDSKIDGKRITTFEIILPRIILAEVNTHKIVSKNYQSSRAIPNEKLLELCTFIPSIWWMNAKGMQPKEIAPKEIADQAIVIWETARQLMIEKSSELAELGIHKQIVNRLIEPWMYTTGVITATEKGLSNLFNLRIHGDAQYEFQELANCILQAYESSIPKERFMHLPYADYREDIPYTNNEFKQKIVNSAATIARVSYINLNANKTYDENLKLFNHLIMTEPVHASPCEHQAFSKWIWGCGFLDQNKLQEYADEGIIVANDLYGNFLDIIQLRKLIEYKLIDFK